ILLKTPSSRNLFCRDAKVKSIEQTMEHAERYLGQICSLLASYTRKTARLRDKADLLVAQIHDFSDTEDPEFQTGLKNLAEDLALVQDHRQAQVARLETRVVAPLKAYGDIIKNKRADLKNFHSNLKRELKELQKLEKIQLRNPADRQSIAGDNAQKVSTDAQRSVQQLEETITDFQRQKLEDIKVSLIHFITVEMLFHAKALEVYTHTCHSLERMSIHRDLEVASANDTVHNTYCLALQQVRSRQYTADTLISHNIKTCSGTSQRTLQKQRGVEEEEEEGEEEEEEEVTSESETEERRHSSRRTYAAKHADMHRRHK
uniref:Family with sequence similarity 92 member B n=1 Tax=Mola mola TaxID=94237 RepID=A0A3Q3VWU3_MOLML